MNACDAPRNWVDLLQTSLVEFMCCEQTFKTSAYHGASGNVAMRPSVRSSVCLSVSRHCSKRRILSYVVTTEEQQETRCVKLNPLVIVVVRPTEVAETEDRGTYRLAANWAKPCSARWFQIKSGYK